MLAAFLLQLSHLFFYTAALPIVSYYPPHKHNKNKPTKHEKNDSFINQSSRQTPKPNRCYIYPPHFFKNNFS